MPTKPNPRRSNGTLRDKIRARVLREETHCWLCGKEVDKTLPHGQPGSPEVDEINPVSKGGSPFDRKNCRLAHRLCNQKRGNRDPHATRYADMRPLKTSRQWR
ncbi:HNH endonuclease [Arthrobacter phage vB_ArS-ArV2]|uniref:HNH endonuclease n=1 Tax=Arthrobacter phage vB_ArS-ArV2 TaxID=1414742 RepID=V5R8P9_9CAUD|nr:HNH endonuclease [Arthrobacter phage vB_ArS-ArV2]AHB31611.1 HNH endonuclease [Arthrobacter phage vB_ArS-ArV2]